MKKKCSKCGATVVYKREQSEPKLMIAVGSEKLWEKLDRIEKLLRGKYWEKAYQEGWDACVADRMLEEMKE
jgi:hypothetical protein